jgi:hypothetical protein
MAQTLSQTITRTQAQASATTATGNGTAVDVTGASAVIFVIKKSSGTAGIVTFEESSDGGENWSTVSCTRASDGNAVTATSAGESGDAFVAAMKDGARQVRARISTAWTTAGAQVEVVALTR